MLLNGTASTESYTYVQTLSLHDALPVSWTSRDLHGVASGLVDLHFFDERQGIAVGAVGGGSSAAEQAASRTVILSTQDGGETWQRSEEHTSELQSLMRTSYAVFCLKKRTILTNSNIPASVDCTSK